MKLELDVLIIDLIFLCIVTPIMLLSAKRIINYKRTSLADYTICLVYVFNCLPVLFDVVLGVPKYVYWYWKFEQIIGDFTLSFIYNAYIVLAMVALGLYARKIVPVTPTNSTQVKYPLFKKIFIVLVIVAPLIYIFIKCGFHIFLSYEPLAMRGVNENTRFVFNQMITISIFSYVSVFFRKERKKIEWAVMLFVFFLLIWINGKRYIIVTVLEEIIFMYQLYQVNLGKKEKRINMKFLVGCICVGIVALSVYYMQNIRIDSSSNYVYSMLRVDFGRDDVTKYAIDEVLLKGHPILEYPGQSFLSLLLFWIPRAIWPSKPYPHYQYLTASLLDVDLLHIPAGTTPSIFEMGICNFGWFGCIVAIVILILVCYFGDRRPEPNLKLFFLLFITMLLTQAIDFVSILIPFAVIIYFLRKFKIKFTFGRTRLS